MLKPRGNVGPPGFRVCHLYPAVSPDHVTHGLLMWPPCKVLMAHKLASAAWFKSQVYHLGLPGGASGKELACTAGDIRDGFDPWSGRSLGEGNGNPFQYSLPVESHGPRSLASYSPWGYIDTTE